MSEDILKDKAAIKKKDIKFFKERIEVKYTVMD